jgi:serine/threonine protein kinase
LSTPKSTDESAPSDHQERLDEVIAAYLEAVEAGHAPSRDGLIDEHPDLADELREFFADQQRMKDFAKHIPSPAAAHQEAIVPQRLRYFGDYELLEEIGRGGQGVVYRAWQHSLGRHVAVKLIRNGEFASEEERRRFVTGARAAAKLDHANIVKIHEIGRQEGFHFFSMDYVQGSNLYQVLCERPLEAKTAARYVQTAARAVHYAHERGTLHRDLKPSNLLIDSAGRVRITDFELARLVDTDPTSAVAPPRITRTGQALGTPGFMPPEQALGKRGLIGPAGDVYSLGATLYALLTGRPPFQADTAAATLQLVLNAEPVAPRLLNPNFPRELEAICLHCLEKEPHRRYPTAAALADDLERFIDNRPIAVRPIGRVGRLWRWSKRNPTVAALAATAALLLVSVTAVATVSYVRESQLRQAADEALARERYLRSQLSASNEQLEQRQARIDALLEEFPLSPSLWRTRTPRCGVWHARL